jgi:Domain of unknown function (DUF6968)
MVIASRILKYRATAGSGDVAISVFAPERESDGTWFCRYEIDWPDGKWASRAGGVDAIQALYLALQMIGSDLYTSNYHKSGQLYLDAPGRGYGFPVPITLRHVLVGDDRRFL